MQTTKQEEWYPFQPDWPQGTLRVDFQSCCNFQQNLLMFVRFLRAQFVVKFPQLLQHCNARHSRKGL